MEEAGKLGRGLVAKIKKDLGVGMMLAYPIALKDDDGTLLVTSPDFPEVTTFGEDREEAIARALPRPGGGDSRPHT